MSQRGCSRLAGGLDRGVFDAEPFNRISTDPNPTRPKFKELNMRHLLEELLHGIADLTGYWVEELENVYPPTVAALLSLPDGSADLIETLDDVAAAINAVRPLESRMWDALEDAVFDAGAGI